MFLELFEDFIVSNKITLNHLNEQYQQFQKLGNILRIVSDIYTHLFQCVYINSGRHSNKVVIYLY